jgi:hypothetical protein
MPGSRDQSVTICIDRIYQQTNWAIPCMQTQPHVAGKLGQNIRRGCGEVSSPDNHLRSASAFAEFERSAAEVLAWTLRARQVWLVNTNCTCAQPSVHTRAVRCGVHHGMNRVVNTTLQLLRHNL